MIATDLLIPLNSVFENEDKFLRTTSLFLAYVVIILGWVGYALCHHFFVVEGTSELDILKNNQTLNFIVLMLGINLGYRIVKWDTRNKKTSFT